MDIPIRSRHYKVTIAGQRRVEIRCEQCSTVFVFVMQRQASGAGTSIYGFDNDGAQQRSVESARRNLTWKLWKEMDVVPCPECGHVQARMIPTARKRRWRPLRIWGVLATIAAAVVGGMNYLMSDGVGAPMILEWPVFWLLASVGPVTLVVRAIANHHYDPNANLEANRERARRWALPKAEWDRIEAEAAEDA